MADDEGVLGNLPNARPGRRSEKRPARPRSATPPPAPAAESDAAAPSDADPLASAIRAATGLAATGARVANGLAREVVRRLPRP